MAFYPDTQLTIVILHNSQSAELFEQQIEAAVLTSIGGTFESWTR